MHMIYDEIDVHMLLIVFEIYMVLNSGIRFFVIFIFRNKLVLMPTDPLIYVWQCRHNDKFQYFL